MRHVEDVNKDGRLDMVFHFPFVDTGFSCADVVGGRPTTLTGTLTGVTTGGVYIVGTDALRLVGD